MQGSVAGTCLNTMYRFFFQTDCVMQRSVAGTGFNTKYRFFLNELRHVRVSSRYRFKHKVPFFFLNGLRH